MVDQVDDVVVTGQRRPSGVADPFPIAGSPVWPPWFIERGEGQTGLFNPCMLPRRRKEWNRDATAASAVRDMKQLAQTQPVTGDRGFSSREYGAVLWEMPDGSLLRGAITWGTHSFLEASQNPNARATVALDWTQPAPGAFPYATVHSHPPGGHIPSGSPGASTIDDYGNLTSVQQWRVYHSGGQANGSEARIYIVADNLVRRARRQ